MERLSNGKIEVHNSWLNNISIIEEFIYSYFSEISPKTAKINNRGYAVINITRSSIIQLLNTMSKTFPRLERKWIKIQQKD